MLFEIAMVVVVVVALAFFTAVPLNVAAKAAMWMHCVRHFGFSKDTKRPKSEPPVVANPAKRGRRVRVVYVRHAESMWNSVFNVFGMGWPLRTLRFFVGEAALFLTGPTASNIIDSPLSEAGRTQVEALAQMVRTSTGRIPSLQPSGESIIVCSNLRRAMQTAAGGLAARIGATRERILIESDLQEGSRNPDASSFSLAPLEVPPGPVHGFDGQRDGAVNLALAFDPAHNQGDKKLSSSVFDRIDAFALRLIGEATAGQKGYFTPSGVAPSTVIAVGHSLYLMKFFQRFLPATSNHHSKTSKIHNCGVVEFDLYVDEQTGQLRVDETTISELYLGFNLKKKKTK